ncbi:DUF2236 domain-containing protein [Streptacidiphilus sp. 4-A2]|nr:DUF2236 domain-containing protein [Streptacidiphilus sp. 4-A2]
MHAVGTRPGRPRRAEYPAVEQPTIPPETLRGEGDPLADRVVAELLDSGEIAHANQVLHSLRRNDQQVQDDLPPVLRDYLTATNPVPAWVDPARITRVHRFFRHDGVHVASALSLGGMVSSYASPVGAKLLHTTHRLDHPHRRLSETTQFLLHMMARDPLGPHGQLVPAIQKVRLIHAAVRQLLLRERHWDVARHGVPICQEDLLGATLIFSVTVLEGMERIGVRCTAQEAEDYYYYLARGRGDARPAAGGDPGDPGAGPPDLGGDGAPHLGPRPRASRSPAPCWTSTTGSPRPDPTARSRRWRGPWSARRPPTGCRYPPAGGTRSWPGPPGGRSASTGARTTTLSPAASSTMSDRSC